MTPLTCLVGFGVCNDWFENQLRFGADVSVTLDSNSYPTLFITPKAHET